MRILSTFLLETAVLLLSALFCCKTLWAAEASKPLSGKQLGLQYECAACHGTNGQSILPGIPHLAGQGERYLLKQIEEIQASRINDGGSQKRFVAEMAALPLLSESEIQILAQYYSKQPAVNRSVASRSIPEVLALGKKIYRGGNTQSGTPACAACHTVSGNGLPAAGFPKISGQPVTYLIKQLTDLQSNKRLNSPHMKRIVARLTKEEIDAVAQYVSALRIGTAAPDTALSTTASD